MASHQVQPLQSQLYLSRYIGKNSSPELQLKVVYGVFIKGSDCETVDVEYVQMSRVWKVRNWGNDLWQKGVT